ncbi:GrBNV gp28-like protein-like protein [Mauternbach virus]|uniref:GrBNV gp28-like protein-like protein n=1 Tax=Mauternbach virus TaxID=2486603 RepID=A0A3G3E862_9VIRU|nr:GrBNV gp28-like protein-like protein [Mauternbach virus]AYP97893.1 GrBNV gp28-like protein-like protein [Mauternbach virus]
MNFFCFSINFFLYIYLQIKMNNCDLYYSNKIYKYNNQYDGNSSENYDSDYDGDSEEDCIIKSSTNADSTVEQPQQQLPTVIENIKPDTNMVSMNVNAEVTTDLKKKSKTPNSSPQHLNKSIRIQKTSSIIPKKRKLPIPVENKSTSSIDNNIALCQPFKMQRTSTPIMFTAPPDRIDTIDPSCDDLVHNNISCIKASDDESSKPNELKRLTMKVSFGNPKWNNRSDHMNDVDGDEQNFDEAHNANNIDDNINNNNHNNDAANLDDFETDDDDVKDRDYVCSDRRSSASASSETSSSDSSSSESSASESEDEVPTEKHKTKKMQITPSKSENNYNTEISKVTLYHEFVTPTPTTIVRRPLLSTTDIDESNEQKVISAVIFREIAPMGDYKCPKYKQLKQSMEKKCITKKTYTAKMCYYKDTNDVTNDDSASPVKKPRKQNVQPRDFCKISYGTQKPNTDSEMIYNDKNLKSLAKIVKSILVEQNNQTTSEPMSSDLKKSKSNNVHKLSDVRVIPSKSGDILRNLSIDHFNHTQHFRAVINNKTVYVPNYTLVYGAVPSHMCEFIQYMIKSNYNTPNMYMYDGDLEIQAYCYWLLVSQDLLKWKNDLSRAPLKRLLENACALITNQSLRERISRFANFRDSRITAECLLQIKYNYVDIMASLNNIVSETEYELAKFTWNNFMAKCGIHHYSCPHTLHEIAANATLVKTQLEATLHDLQLQNADYESGIKFTVPETEQLFNYVLRLFPTKYKIRPLQISTTNAFVHLCNMFAYHIIEMGILTGNGTKITKNHVAGFRSRHLKLLSINTMQLKIPIFTNKFRSMSSTIHSAISMYYSKNLSGYEIPTIKMDRNASEYLFEMINLVLLKRSEFLCHFNKDDVFQQKDCITVILSHEIDDLFESPEFTSIHDIDAWTRTDDADLNQYNETSGVLEKSFYDTYIEEDNKLREQLESDYSCDEDFETIEISDDELAELKIELKDITTMHTRELIYIKGDGDSSSNNTKNKYKYNSATDSESDGDNDDDDDDDDNVDAVGITTNDVSIENHDDNIIKNNKKYINNENFINISYEINNNTITTTTRLANNDPSIENEKITSPKKKTATKTTNPKRKLKTKKNQITDPNDDTESQTKVMTKSEKLKKKKAKAKANKTAIEEACLNDEHYKWSRDRTNSRAKCVMCGKASTSKCINIGTAIWVTCCTKCHTKLVLDRNKPNPEYDHAEILRRIEYQYKMPVAFNIEQKFIERCDFNYVFATKKYNRANGSKSLYKRLRKTLPPGGDNNNKNDKNTAVGSSDSENDDDDDSSTNNNDNGKIMAE